MTIKIKKENKGKFNALKKRTGKSTEQLTHSKNPLTRKRAVFAQNASHWKHEEGGLVQYNFGGAISGAGGLLGAIPTPFTQIAGAAMGLVGGIVGGAEEKKAAEQAAEQARIQQATGAAIAGQSTAGNRYIATMANGGEKDTLRKVDQNSFNEFSTKMQTNKDLQSRARINYYNSRLDSALYGNDLNKWDSTRTATAFKDRVNYADSVINAGGFNKSLSGPQVQNILGNQYPDYVSTKNNYVNPNAVSGSLNLDPMVYGLRNSFAAPIPRYGSVQVLDKTPVAEYSANSKWNPASGYSLDIKKEKQFYAMGGMIPNMMPNVEVEGGEVLQGKDKSLAKVEGPKHSSGGVQLYMENGGRVFSDKLINPKTGNTFAKDAERYMKMMK